MSDSQSPRHIIMWSSDEALAGRIAGLEGQGFTVTASADPDEARCVLESGRPAAVLADPELNSPAASDFLRTAHRAHPDLPVALVRPVDDALTFHYLRIYAASGALGPHEAISDGALRLFLEHLTRTDAGFGLETYLNGPEEVHKHRLESPGGRNPLLVRIGRAFEEHGRVEPHDIQLVYEETLNNAIFHAFRTASNESRYMSHADTPFDASEELQVQWASRPDLGALAVIDNQGLLSPHVVWDRFFRQTSLKGLLDTNGRGLYLAHLLSQLLLVTVVPGVRTQIATLFLPQEGEEHGRAVCFRVFPQR